jgi:sortase A
MRRLEYALGSLSAVLLIIAGVAYADGMIGSNRALEAFASAQQALLETDVPNQTDWSNSRRVGYTKSLKTDIGMPNAVLRIPDLDVEVAVFEGTGKVELNRGVGIVDGTALPGEQGNIAIAGHRDGFFRPLENIPAGTTIELVTLTGTQMFSVADVKIVDPFELSVLEQTDNTVLTLITCYPFKYVGYAPDRYIVRAHLTGDNDTDIIAKR